jgi:competence protein ComEA
MQFNTLKHLTMTVALLLTATFSNAVEQKAMAASSAVATAKPPASVTKKADSKPVVEAKARLVDINSAGRNELKTLPGVTDAVADKVIAGRPFGSKAQLTTRGILPRDVYENLKGLVIAKQNANTTAKILGK